MIFYVNFYQPPIDELQVPFCWTSLMKGLLK